MTRRPRRNQTRVIVRDAASLGVGDIIIFRDPVSRELHYDGQPFQITKVTGKTITIRWTEEPDNDSP